MRCIYPLKGYRSRTVNPSGNRSIVFDKVDGFADMPVTVPCGRCIACRLERSRQWAMRCMHEASLHDENCFITLTYDDEHLPEYDSLDPRALQLFLKRLRKRYADKRIRFYGCGEYGDYNGRPHYHICLFGFDFPDKVHFTTRKGFTVWTSAALEKLWDKGFSEIGSVTFESAAYVARYFLKKTLGAEDAKATAYDVVDPESGEVVARKEAEFSRMSRRPGIGREWFDKFKDETYKADSVIVRGREMRPPRFYDGAYEALEPRAMKRIKRRRLSKVNEDEQEWERLQAHEANLIARTDLSKRSV